MNNKTEIEFYYDTKKDPIVSGFSIDGTYFSYLFKNQQTFTLAGYIKNSGIQKLGFSKRPITISLLRTSATRFHQSIFNEKMGKNKYSSHTNDKDKELDNNQNQIVSERKNLAKYIKKSIGLFTTGKKNYVYFNSLPYVEFIHFDKK